MTLGRAILFGTLTVGALDLADALIFFGLRGASPIRICQSIAAGLLGRNSFTGGLPTAALGVALHFFIAFVVVLTYCFASTKLRFLTDHALLCGPLYGWVVYVTMNFAVIPLSAANRAPFSWPVLINGLLIHAVGVGLPSALFARAAVPPGN